MPEFMWIVGMILAPIGIYLIARLITTAHFNAKLDFVRKLRMAKQGDRNGKE